MHGPPILGPVDALASSLAEAGPSSLMSASLMCLPQGCSNSTQPKQARVKLAFFSLPCYFFELSSIVDQ